MRKRAYEMRISDWSSDVCSSDLLKTRLDAARVEAERAQREGKLEKASRLLYAEIPSLERELMTAEQAESSGDRMVNDQVTDEDIAAVIAAWTGIPVGRLLQGETEKLLHLESDRKSVV